MPFLAEELLKVVFYLFFLSSIFFIRELHCKCLILNESEDGEEVLSNVYTF